MLLKEHLLSILDTVGQSVVVVDGDGRIDSANAATSIVWGLGDQNVIGRSLNESALVSRCPELPRRLQECRDRHTILNFECSLSHSRGESILAVRLRPVFAEDQSLLGTVIYAEDITPREHLQSTVLELEKTSKELQSANNELEATNAELQSATEELETMHEELQFTNEELETTNEELHALNEELETMNTELRARTEEMDQLNVRYVETLERMPFPIMLLDEKLRIDFLNSGAQRLFGFKPKAAVELDLEQLPVSEAARKLLRRKHQNALQRNAPLIASGDRLGIKGLESATVQFTQVRYRNQKNVLVMIQPDPRLHGSDPTRVNPAKDTVAITSSKKALPKPSISVPSVRQEDRKRLKTHGDSDRLHVLFGNIHAKPKAPDKKVASMRQPATDTRKSAQSTRSRRVK
jgi:PAS domain S-box-containing protein